MRSPLSCCPRGQHDNGPRSNDRRVVVGRVVLFWMNFMDQRLISDIWIFSRFYCSSFLGVIMKIVYFRLGWLHSFSSFSMNRLVGDHQNYSVWMLGTVVSMWAPNMESPNLEAPTNYIQLHILHFFFNAWLSAWGALLETKLYRHVLDVAE